MCEYGYRNGKKCHREALGDSERGYYLLHEGWKKKDEETREQFYKEIEEGEMNFDGCVLPGFDLSEREVGLYISFQRATIEGDVVFREAIVGCFFDGANIKGNARFDGATIGGDALFMGATIGGASFQEATMERIASFHLKNTGYFTLKDAQFKFPIMQEHACREAKIVNERRGDRELADYHFYRDDERQEETEAPCY